MNRCFFFCSEMARRAVGNSWVVFYLFGRRELCTTTACWTSSHKSSVSSLSVLEPGPAGCTLVLSIGRDIFVISMCFF